MRLNLEGQLAERKRELAEMEECIGYLHAEADTRSKELSEQQSRALVALRAGQELTAQLADCRSKLAAKEAAHVEQVCCHRSDETS